jgi:antiviral helicase SKI2
VEANSIKKQKLIRPMRTAVELLEEVVQSWIADSKGASERKIPEVDWRKMKALEFQETLQSRGELERKNRDRSCLLCPDFDIHVGSFARSGTDFGRELNRPFATVAFHRGFLFLV